MFHRELCVLLPITHITSNPPPFSDVPFDDFQENEYFRGSLSGRSHVLCRI